LIGLGIAGLIGIACAPAVGWTQPKPPDADSWRDSTRHKVGFVQITSSVRLHYLDFGGTGPAIVFLPGLGNTAHAFDNFAPSFTDRFHVVALTRRGFGESSHPETGYETPRLVEDIRTAIDKLHLGRVILIGHSIAGEEMTRFAGTYPDRVAKLVYLDAAYDRVPKGHTYSNHLIRIQTSQGVEGVGVMGYRVPDEAFYKALRTLLRNIKRISVTSVIPRRRFSWTVSVVTAISSARS
jgi:pimeloyl-ACP methyl ester carboxylesterase